jgi:predicted nucleic acid-binding Zn ribbon protein
MKRIEPESAGDVLRQLLEEENMISRLEEYKAIDLWPRIVGLQMSRRTSRPTVKSGIMTIGVPAAPLRQELTMNRSQLVELINKALGKEVIKDIRFVS